MLVQTLVPKTSVEALDMKAAYVRDHEAEIINALEASLRLPKQLQTHDLFKLAKLVGFAPTSGEELVVRRLAHAATWSGRYPVPDTEQGFVEATLSDGRKSSLSWYKGRDIQEIKALIQRVRDQQGV